MRPKKWKYTIAAASLTGYASNATGVTWPLTATTAGDGLAHPVTVKNDSVTDHSAKTMILAGTDAEDRPQTETMNLPGTSATVTSVKYYKTLESVTPSATIGADTMDIGWTAVGYTPIYPLSHPMVGQATLQCDVNGSTINYTPQQTVMPVFTVNGAAPSWIAAVAAGAASTITTLAQAATGFRILVNSHTSGVLYVGISQARV